MIRIIFFWSCKLTHYQAACLTSCCLSVHHHRMEDFVRMEDLILPLSLSTWVSLQSWELWIPIPWISSVPISGMMKTPAAPSSAEWFSSVTFNFCSCASNAENNQIPHFNVFTRKKPNELGILSSASNVAWSSPPRQRLERRRAFCRNRGPPCADF